MGWTDHGYVFLGPLLDEPALDALRETLLQARDGLRQNTYGILKHNLWLESAAFERVLSDRLAPAVLERLGLPAIVFFQDNLVWKPPGTKEPLAWHQDFSYWPLSEPGGATLWLALDDVDAGNGCMRYVPGSHLWGERRAADFVVGAGQPTTPSATGTQDPKLPPLEVDETKLTVLDVPLRAGEAVLHHPLLWHMSPGNPSIRERRAWSLTFVYPEARWDPEHASHPYNLDRSLVAGAPVEGAWFPVFRK